MFVLSNSLLLLLLLLLLFNKDAKDLPFSTVYAGLFSHQSTYYIYHYISSPCLWYIQVTYVCKLTFSHTLPEHKVTNSSPYNSTRNVKTSTKKKIQCFVYIRFEVSFAEIWVYGWNIDAIVFARFLFQAIYDRLTLRHVRRPTNLHHRQIIHPSSSNWASDLH